ncbi:tail completion protein gp17 [Bacillus altitudinis]|uniref:tail completion protein gp17 n=1 Tax=Bacillus altitudinis TaxID=293387 RepID=UPI003CF322CC
MSLDAKKELSAALIKNNELKQLVTGGFHNLVADDVAAFPRVVFSEITNRDQEYRDNHSAASEVRFQLSIFSKADSRMNETEIAKQIDRLMKGLGYGRYDSVDLYETDTKIFHRGMRYVKTFF